MTNKMKDQLTEMLIEHSRAMYSIMSDMGVIYVAWIENSESNKEILEKKVIKLKFDIEEATSIKNQTIREFSEALTLGSGDWAILLQKMDNLSDLALKFIDLLMYIELRDVNSAIKSKYHKAINEILEMAKLLKESIKMLLENPRNIIFDINKIHELGNSTDIILHQLLHYLYKDKNLEIRNLLIIRDTVVTLEQIVEKLNHIAEIIRVMRYE